MANNSRLLVKSLDFLGYGRSWARNLGFFSKSKKAGANSSSEKEKPKKWGPAQEKNAIMHGKDIEPKLFLDEPIPEHFLGHHLENPVRNTEREYFQTHQNPNWEGHNRGIFDSRFYSKKYGISKEVYAWLHWDLNVDDNDEIQLLRKKTIFRSLREDQRHIEERVQVLGYELAAAHFIVARGGAVKFEDREHWFVKDANNNYALPRKYMDNLFVEAIDASNTKVTHVAFDILGSLSKIRYLKFRNCEHLDDWCLACLQRLQGSLEFLDIENCAGVTDNGLSSLQCLSKLQGLRVSNLPNVKHLGLLTLLLEEHLPNLKVMGVTEEDLKPPVWSHRGEQRLVRALLGHLDLESDPDPFPEAQEIPTENSEDDSYIYKRLVVKAD